MTLLFIAALALLAFGLALHRRDLALWMWLLVCGFVPFWVGVTTPFYLCALSIVGMAIIAGALWHGHLTYTDHDLWIALLAVLIVSMGVLGIARPGDVTSVIAQWIVSYVVARILVESTGPEAAYRAIAVVFSAVAVGAIFEYSLHINPYFSWVVDNSQYHAWGAGQIRGGTTRAEWAFGHSIALGCSLGMAIPLIVATGQRGWVKIVQVALCGLAVVFTFSRAGFMTAVVGLVLALLFSRDAGSARLRFMALAAAGALVYFVTPLINSVFRADNGQAEVSSDYRGLLNSLIATMRPFGLAQGYSEGTRGSYTFGSFQSIDSTFVFLGVSFGYVIALIALVGAAVWAVRALMRRGSPAELGVVAVVPALFTVAPITQFGSLVFFYVGMGVAVSALRRGVKTGPSLPPTHRPSRSLSVRSRPLPIKTDPHRRTR